jgi:hypothetical protein
MKIIRNKDSKNKQHDINLDTGDVTPVTPDLWSTKKRSQYEKCLLLVKQLTDRAINIIDEKTITTVAHSMAIFGEPGREMFVQICVHQTQFDTDQLKECFDMAARTAKFKTPTKFIDICRTYGLQVLIGEDEYEYLLLEGTKPVWYTNNLEDDQIRSIQEHGFMELRNQYYFAEINREEKRITLTPKSNFVLRVLYHINRGKNNKRVIGLKNNKNQSLIMEIETKELSSLQAFKNLTEGMGNFIVSHLFKDPELQRVKRKLFDEEKPSTQLEVLGWDNKGRFFAFCNGLYHLPDKKDQEPAFYSVDDYGIVTLGSTHYHIPYHPGTEPYQFLNEKKIYFQDTKIDFKTWSALYLRAFGMIGSTVLTFTVATIFSDHIFSVINNFPLLFLYGEGGSGKGTVCEFVQHLFGQPQPPLKLTERANTDKARVRKFATYCNVPVRLEEFSNSIDMAGIKTVTNLYDRFGYERSSMDTRYGTETVPIRSTVMITGNEYPADDPLMQRNILMDADRNKRSDTEIAAFRALQKINQDGITTILTEILGYRKAMETSWRAHYETEYDKFRNECKDLDVPSRMIHNYAVLLATHKCMSEAGLTWPHSFVGFKRFLKMLLINQAEKRNTGAVVQRFWNIVLGLANQGTIIEGREFHLDGNKLFIRFTEIHNFYLREHVNTYRQPGLLQPSMLQKLKISPAFIEYRNSQRFGKVNTSCFVFDYQKIGIDLVHVINTKRLATAAARGGHEPNLIEREEDREAREADEKQAKMIRAGEIHHQAVSYRKSLEDLPEDPGEEPM